MPLVRRKQKFKMKSPCRIVLRWQFFHILANFNRKMESNEKLKCPRSKLTNILRFITSYKKINPRYSKLTSTMMRNVSKWFKTKHLKLKQFWTSEKISLA